MAIICKCARRGLGALAALALSLGLALAPAAAQSQGGSFAFQDPASLDAAVAQFLGAGIGEAGGARAPVDRRLRLKRCTRALKVGWHGRAGTSVKVECPDPSPWRVFVAVVASAPAAPSAKVVRRGDAMTVLVRGRGFTIQQSGEAIEAGAVGEWIKIRITRRGDPIHARIERPGLAVIPFE